jgi:non-heme chloroperoxidase
MFASLLVYDDTAELATLRPPTMLVWGDADRLVGREMQDRLGRLLPRAELSVYEGAGHTPRWEQPARFAGDVAAFASRVLV